MYPLKTFKQDESVSSGRKISSFELEFFYYQDWLIYLTSGTYQDSLSPLVLTFANCYKPSVTAGRTNLDNCHQKVNKIVNV